MNFALVRPLPLIAAIGATLGVQQSKLPFAEGQKLLQQLEQMSLPIVKPKVLVDGQRLGLLLRVELLSLVAA